MNLDFSVFPTLRSERLVLRQLNSNDAEEILFIRGDEEMTKYVGIKKTKTIADATDWIKNINNNISANKCIVWGITEKDHDNVIGTISLWNFEPEIHLAEVGYMLNSNYQNKGYMNDAMQLALDFGISNLGFKTITAYTHQDNSTSISLLRKNNFSKNRELEEKHVGKTEPETTVIYSLDHTKYNC